LKLDPKVRDQYDVSSLECVVHAAAPCPVDVKKRMLDWWGPIIYEYYAGTEGIGGTIIGPDEWLAHPGSVGKPLSVVHILDEEGSELPTGHAGAIYFEGGAEFEYHNDPVKTASVRNDKGWRTLGDIGYVDEEGYLYLTDRASFMIVSGGVNIYPQEAENLLLLHPSVTDAAVFGVPNRDFGEEVKAVVQPAPSSEAGLELERTLIDYCRANLAHHKCPRSIDFLPELPRDPNGKLYKRRLRDSYWDGHDTKLL
jgi:long-chain acyl-CoA synthetase